MVLAVTGGAFAKVIHVDDDAPPGGDGSSWPTAYTFLQDALAEAETTAEPVEIRVAQGIYRPDVGTGYRRGDATATFDIPSGTVLVGGFAGTQANDPGARDPQKHRTVLTGDLDGDDLPVVARSDFMSGPTARNRSDNAQNVVTVRDAEPTVIIDGFTIAGGHCGTRSRRPIGYGGGVRSLQSNLVVRNCRFQFNFAATEGGALSCEGGDIVIERCTFDRNGARGELTGYGGAIGCTETSLTVFDSVFTANLSGALSASDCERVVVSNCLFAGNLSNACASAITAYACHLNLRQCTFDEDGPYRTLRAGGTPENPGVIDICGCIFPLNEPLLLAQSPMDVTVSYSNVTRAEAGVPDIIWGEGNIDADPRFAAPGYWDPNGTPDDTDDDFWVEGDYHLKSRAGRWDPVGESWVQDEVTSLCIDAGDPESAVAFEPYPNGGLVNMGAYGGTAEASKSPTGLHAVYGGGNGTVDEPYLIYTAEHLSALGASVEDWNAHFRLIADIDLGSHSADNFNIIGRYDEDEPFTGTFDGNGHTIANFRYAGPETNVAGLFGYVTRDTAEIANLTLASPSVDGGAGESCGSLVGYLGRGTIRGCRAEGAVVTDGRNVGGLVGYNWAGTIAGCSAAGRVAGAQNVGGLLGGNRSGTVSECCAAVAVSGQDDVGGLVGDTSGGAILRCYAAGTVSGSGADIGGLVADNAGILRDCYSTATVEAGPYTVSVGGLVGENAGGGTIDHCYAAGSVTAGTGAREVGGLVGRNGGAVSHCFWDTQATGQVTSAGGAGKTTAEMQTPETFLAAGWDFVDETENGAEDVWYLPESDYPCLAWEFLAELP